MRMLSMVATVLAAFFACCTPTRADLTPQQQAAASALVAQFSSPDFNARTQAVEKLVEMGKKLLEHHDPREVAAYLLFLDATNKSQAFTPLDLDKVIGPPAPAIAPAG